MKNLTWKEEFDRRVRRVVGVRDDTLPVDISGGEMGFCPTCADYTVWVTVGNCTENNFESFSGLLNAILAVPWTDVHD